MMDEKDEIANCREIVFRQYQIELINQSKSKNAIIFLPCGAGKTFISIGVLRSRYKDLAKSNKRVAIFLANTQFLVLQLSQLIENFTNYEVRTLLGEMGVDNWTDDCWRRELVNKQIICSTPAIFLLILQKKLINLTDVSLLVLDECHHAVQNHPYNEIMREFQFLEESERPQVLGLTASVLNSSPKKGLFHYITTLKKNLCSEFVKTDKLYEVFQFSPNPEEFLVEYEKTDMTPIQELLLDILDKSASFSNCFKSVSPDKILSEAGLPKDSVLLMKYDSFRREIKNMYFNLQRVIQTLGLLATFNLALYYLIRMERLKILHKDAITLRALTHTTTVLNKIRRIIYKLMSADDQRDVKKFCSDKVKVLIDFVASLKNNCTEDVKCIIFVTEKVTALSLAYIFNLINDSDEFFKADFITGSFFNLMLEPDEFSRNQLSNRNVMKRFQNEEFNFLFATAILLEGIDLPLCSFIINFDEPNCYNVYIQSKGRARSKKSIYVTLVEKRVREKLEEKIIQYKTVYDQLLKVVFSDMQSDDESDDSASEAHHEEEFVFLDKSKDIHISASSAVSLIYRFCNYLPQDNHSLLSPVCSYDVNKSRAYLSMPYSSGIRHIIAGDVKRNRNLARKNVFMKAVRELYEKGAITETLKFRAFPSEDEAFAKSFPNFKATFSIDNVEQEEPTKNKPFEIHCGENLCQSLPCPKKISYLHVIKVTPQFSRPEDVREGVFYDFFCDSHHWAILSSKKMNKICDFPLYLRMGELKCGLVVNAKSFKLSSEELFNIRKFHFLIFNCLLKVVKRLQVFDIRNEECSFFVVPVIDLGSGNYDINWSLIDYETRHSELSSLNSLECDKPTIDEYLFSVIYPKYRGTTAKYYVVTSLDHEQTPLSKFPSQDFMNYYTYFKEKYQVEIKDTTQPLIEVKPLPEKINFLKPAISAVYKKKREENESFKEYLIPELCCRMSFPASMWLKALMLPSALYRITSISCIDDFRKVIAQETELDGGGDDDDPEWLPLEIEVNNEEEHNTIGQFDPCNLRTRNSIFSSQHHESEMPSIDPFRNMMEIAPCDLKHYLKCINYGSEAGDEKSGSKIDQKTSMDFEVPDLPVKDENNLKRSELRVFVKAFTCKSANDIYDLERFEFFGDSFLKFAAALYLFRTYDHNVGFLASTKDKIISNEHIYLCSVSRGLHKGLIVNEFEPKAVWNAPLFCYPSEIQKPLSDVVILDYGFEIPMEEKLDGKLSQQTLVMVQELCRSKESKGSMYTQTDNTLKKSNLNKKIADSIEALIGFHVLDHGLLGGFKVLNWLKILPIQSGSYEALLKTQYEVSLYGDIDVFDHLNAVSCDSLEQVIGYKFKNKAILLEALTHPSYECGKMPSYERLEFLGDAVLDFIITIYIYENMKDASAGDMTDIRSSLVNNIIMACLTVKYGFHKYLLHDSSSLLHAIKEFSVFQKKRNYRVDNDIMVLSEEGEDRWAESIEVPKALADIFESLAAAIFLDSGNSLETVWKTYYRLIAGVIDDFMQNPPKSPVRMLHEMCKNEFVSHIKVNGTIETVCKIFHNDKEELFYARGRSKEKTKYCAAKLALRFLYSSIKE